MARKAKTEEYYSLAAILKEGATYNVVIGERSNGKTYAALEYAIKKYFAAKSKGAQMAYMRRWKEDITGRRASDLFTALETNGVIEKYSKGKFTGLHYWAHKFYFCVRDEKGKAVYTEQDVFCHTFALSEMEHDKGISYPKIQTIVFDEFLTNRMYLVNEFVAFMNTVSTIVRRRTNVIVLMLANTVNLSSPYFTEMGLSHVLKMEPGQIDVYRYGEDPEHELLVAVERCSSTGKKASNRYFAFDNIRLGMIKSGQWELPAYPHCPTKYAEKDVVFRYFIEYLDDIFQANVVVTETGAFTYIHRKTTPLQSADEIVFSKTPNERATRFTRLTEFPKLAEFYRRQKVFFQDNEVGTLVTNFIRETERRGSLEI